jgi:hypothetical protein
MSIPQESLRDEIPRNEAYIEVRRSASGPEGLRPGGTRDEGNPPKADKRSRWAFSDSLLERHNNGRGIIFQEVRSS